MHNRVSLRHTNTSWRAMWRDMWRIRIFKSEFAEGERRRKFGGSRSGAAVLSWCRLQQVSVPPVLHPFLPLSRKPWTKRPRQLPTLNDCMETLGSAVKLCFTQVLFTSQSCHAIDPACIDMGCGYGRVLTQSQRQDKVVRVSKECAADTHRKCKRRVAED